MQVGDVIYIKSYPPDEGLIIKGVGFLRTSEIFAVEELGGAFRRVAWFWRGTNISAQSASATTGADITHCMKNWTRRSS
jgi:hypothetical protein